MLQALSEEYADDGVRFIGVNSRDTNLDVAQEFIEELEVTYPSVLDESGRIAFDYGIAAGLPGTVIQRAQQVLTQLEQPTTSAVCPEPAQEACLFDPLAPRSHPLLEEVRQLDIFSLTPLDALNKLADIQRRIDADQDARPTLDQKKGGA